MSQLLMRAKFTRCDEPIHMRVDKRDYLFQKNPAGDFVAIIDSAEHANYLEQTGNFERYDQEAAMKKAQEQWADDVLKTAEAKTEAGTVDEPESDPEPVKDKASAKSGKGKTGK